MGVTKDFITSTIADALAPTFRRPMEDLIYETLDRRQIPTRTDFKELRDLVNSLRGQVSGSVQSLRALSEQQEELEEKVESVEQQEGNTPVDLKPMQEKLEAIVAQIQILEKNLIIDSLNERIVSLETQQKEILEAHAKLQAQNADLEKTLLKHFKPESCLVDNCNNKIRARGFCSNHYKKFQRGTLDGFVNSGGRCRINKKYYIVDRQFEGQPFTHDKTTLSIKDKVFELSKIAESK